MRISEVKGIGIGPKRAEALAKLGIIHLEDALKFVPVRYMDFTAVTPIYDVEHMQYALIVAGVTGASYPRRGRNGMSLLMSRCMDETGALTLVWFNQPYMFNKLKSGCRYKFYGKVQVKDNRKYLINPIFEPEAGQELVGVRPVYGLPKGCGISQSLLRSLIGCALAQCDTKENFPEGLRSRFRLASKRFALENIHFPQSSEAFALAKRTVAFEELVILLLSLQLHGEENAARRAEPLRMDGLLEQYAGFLPFALTHAQKRAIQEISADTTKDRAMNRLLQGDVGSGKTAVAFYCAFAAVKNDGQCVIMAPTEILARQHFNDFTHMFPDISVAYLYGGMKKKEREQALRAIASGEVKVVVGTHAVLRVEVAFYRLLFIITDEQHRFGVVHRATLDSKGRHPHTLVMSATPIPRTLALVLFNDLALSVLDELPPGRQKIATHVIPPGREGDLFTYIAGCCKEGMQSYVVCPLVELNEDFAARSAQEMYDMLLDKVPSEKIALMHGKMSAADKKTIMEGFAAGEIQVLVSTTVIEVGVNVPAAVNMVIVDAERFGLSQLHQLRGRVGRGTQKSYCFLLATDKNERLEIMTQTNDGFVIAQKDLELRGPGEYFGQKQSGVPSTLFSALFADMKLVNDAKEALSCICHAPEYTAFYAGLRAAVGAQNEDLSKNIIYN